MVGSILFAVSSLIFCFLFCWFRAEKATIYSLCLKITASFCFLMCGVFAIKSVGESSINLLIILGLVLGLIGDILLDLKIMYPKDSDNYFVAGTLSFSLGHFFYFLAISLFNSSTSFNTLPWNILVSIAIAIVITLSIILPSKKLGINFGKHLYIIILYTFILSFMCAFSVAIAIFTPIFWIFASAMICFFLSDLILSLQYFGGKDQKIWIYINHILYYIAQAMIAFSLLYLVI